MKLEEAITDLSIQREVKMRLGKTHEAQATGLGIEALKRETLFRSRVPKKDWSLLPGETKD